MREWKKPIVNELSVDRTLCLNESGGYTPPPPCPCWGCPYKFTLKCLCCNKLQEWLDKYF